MSIGDLMSKRKDLTGTTYGKWIVQHFSHIKEYTSRSTSHWMCKCECGTTRTVAGINLISGISTSCGCSKGKAVESHGMSYTKTYKSWEAMKARCTNPNSTGYYGYGAKGVKVSPEWIASFETFLEDMGERPAGTSLDRIDNTIGYNAANCKWATPKEQANNRSTNRYHEYNGELTTLTQIANLLGITAASFSQRLKILPYEECFSLGKQSKILRKCGVPTAEIALKVNCSPTTVRKYLTGKLKSSKFGVAIDNAISEAQST